MGLGILVLQHVGNVPKYPSEDAAGTGIALVLTSRQSFYGRARRALALVAIVVDVN